MPAVQSAASSSKVKIQRIDSGRTARNINVSENLDEQSAGGWGKAHSVGASLRQSTSWSIQHALDEAGGESGNAWTGRFETVDDFIGFEPDSDDEEDEEPTYAVREWDKGKVKGKDREREREKDVESGSKKRKRGVYESEDAEYSRRHEGGSRKAPWASKVDWARCRNAAEMLHQEVIAFLDYICPSPEEHEVRSMVVELISRAVKRSFPDANVLAFGSFETKLYLPLGDIDLVIQSRAMEYRDKVQILRTLASIMKRAGIANQVTIIAKAKVPIIKFVTTYGRFSVDISINQINGVTAGKMVNQFLAELPALRALVMVVKAFLHQRSMNEVYAGGLGSYSIVCLAVSFLQMHPKIRRGEIDPSQNLGVLVMEFFELYGCYFNYEQTGISIRGGGTYFSKADRGWQDPRKAFLLSIEDPGDISNDISRGSFAIHNVRVTFAGAYGIMAATACQRASTIRARHDREYERLRGYDRDDPDPEEMSILSNIIGVTRETINHRSMIKELYEDGTLDELLGITRDVKPKMSNGARHRDSPRRKRRSPSPPRLKIEEELGMAAADADEEEKPVIKHEDGDDVDSRYDIQRGGPARKRQRTGVPQRDLHTVYTTDSEEEDGGTVSVVKSEVDSLAAEEQEYASDTSSEEEKPTISSATNNEIQVTKVINRVKIDRKRAFWASKGLSTPE